MGEIKKFGIGFVTGRPNVCNIINETYLNILEQLKRSDYKFELTIYILIDLKYQKQKIEDFYAIAPEVFEKVNIRYLENKEIEDEKNRLYNSKVINQKDIDLFFGYGHAKGRNTLMYFAKKDKMDYLLFWDDDEYPVACLKNNNSNLVWKKQDNVLLHIQNLENADVTIGYHCGYISPIPYVELGQDVKENDFKQYIEAISNEAFSWESIKEKMITDKGITYADKNILDNLVSYEIKKEGIGKWVAGSTLCLNLKNCKKIPAFYNPPEARGEDTFFSVNLNNLVVKRVPIYHFHDGFLKYKEILKEIYPVELRKIKGNEDEIEKRFFNASRGWIKYKPLFLYLTNKRKYKKEVENNIKKLEKCINEIDKMFDEYDFNMILEDFKNYSNNVKIHYGEFKRTNYVWKKLKKELGKKK